MHLVLLVHTHLALVSANVESFVAGFLLENEVAHIKEAVEAPERPFVAILGGSKVSDKVRLLSKTYEADKVLVGGMTYILQAQVSKSVTHTCRRRQIGYGESSSWKIKQQVLPVDSKANALQPH